MTNNERKLRIKALHVRLTRDKKNVSMRILKQAFCDGDTTFSSDEFPVDACSYPELANNTVWLRGRDKHEDNSIANINFDTIKQAKIYYASLIRTFETLKIRYE